MLPLMLKSLFCESLLAGTAAMCRPAPDSEVSSMDSTWPNDTQVQLSWDTPYYPPMAKGWYPSQPPQEPFSDLYSHAALRSVQETNITASDLKIRLRPIEFSFRLDTLQNLTKITMSQDQKLRNFVQSFSFCSQLSSTCMLADPTGEFYAHCWNSAKHPYRLDCSGHRLDSNPALYSLLELAREGHSRLNDRLKGFRTLDSQHFDSDFQMRPSTKTLANRFACVAGFGVPECERLDQLELALWVYEWSHWYIRVIGFFEDVWSHNSYLNGLHESLQSAIETGISRKADTESEQDNDLDVKCELARINPTARMKYFGTEKFACKWEHDAWIQDIADEIQGQLMDMLFIQWMRAHHLRALGHMLEIVRRDAAKQILEAIGK